MTNNNNIPQVLYLTWHKGNNKYNISIQFSYSCMVRRHALPQKKKKKTRPLYDTKKRNTDKNYELPQNI